MAALLLSMFLTPAALFIGVLSGFFSRYFGEYSVGEKQPKSHQYSCRFWVRHLKGILATLDHPLTQSLPTQQNTPNLQRKGVFLAIAVYARLQYRQHVTRSHS